MSRRSLNQTHRVYDGSRRAEIRRRFIADGDAYVDPTIAVLEWGRLSYDDRRRNDPNRSIALSEAAKEMRLSLEELDGLIAAGEVATVYHSQRVRFWDVAEFNRRHYSLFADDDTYGEPPSGA